MSWMTLLVLLISSTAYAAEIIDLGTFSSVCDLPDDVPESKINIKTEKHIDFNIPKGELFFKPRLLVNSTVSQKTIFKTGATNIRIFVFGAKDEYSKTAIKEFNVDYAICVNFESIKDIADFRKETGLKIPIQIATEETLKFLEIDSYPSIIVLRGSEKDESNSH